MAGMLRHRTYLEVRLPNIKHNVDLIRQHYAPNAKLIAMVKGDAYGNGLERVSGYLHEHCDVHHFGVASLGEATAILEANRRTINTGRNNHVVVFSDTELMDESMHHYYKSQNSKFASGAGAAQLWPVLGTRHQLDMFARHRRTTFKDTPLLLKVNTGMNRLGVRPEELEDLAPTLRECGGVDVLLQHFNVSGLVGHSFTAREYAAFTDAKKLLQDAGVEVRGTSVANSGAIEQRIGVEETFVRPGLMLYGPTSLNRTTIRPEEADQYRLWDGKACGYFYAKVLHHYVGAAGSYVGYGITRNLLTEDAVIALLSIGYADGFLRYYAKMPITVTPATSPHGAPGEDTGGLVGRVHGNVNMDMISVAVYPHEVGKSIEEIMELVQDESEVLIWGQNIEAKAEAVKSIPYQLMCGLSTRVPRRYVE